MRRSPVRTQILTFNHIVFYIQTVIVVIDCETVPCKNNATCHHESHCECAPGWTGHVCDKEGTLLYKQNNRIMV